MLPPRKPLSGNTTYPRPRPIRIIREVMRFWYVAFLVVPGVIISNLVVLVADKGFSALTDATNLKQAFLITQLSQILTTEPLVVIPALALVAALIFAGRIAHKDKEREKQAKEEEERRNQTERVKEEVLIDTVRAMNRRIARAGVMLPVLSPEPTSKEPQGPPFDSLETTAHFVGRASELDKLLVRLREGGAHYVLAVQGLGGVGKTTLAAQVIYYLREENAFSDGIGVVAAQNITNVTLIVRLALARFDPMRRQPTATTPEALAEAAQRLLEGKRTLIVFDNVEPELDIKQVVEPLTAAGAAVLLTARQELPVGVPLELGLFSKDEAVELFANEYGAGSPADLTESQSRSIERIVTALGRHTLAVKMAAHDALDRDLDLEKLANDLEDPRTATTLEGVELIFSKSAAALPPPARRLFGALGAFATAEFGANAVLALAREVCHVDAQPTIDLLVRRALVARSMLSGAPAGSDATRLQLHPVLQGFARRELDGWNAKDHDLPARAIATYYANYSVTAQRDAFAADERNIEGALQWAHNAKLDEQVARMCVGMQPYWRDYGRMAARQKYLPWGLEAAERLKRRRIKDADSLLALLKLGNAQLQRLTGHPDEAERISQGILPVFRKTHNLRGEGSALVLLGNIARDRSDSQAAERYLHQALQIFQRPDVADKANEALAYSFIGQVVQRRGTRLAEAERYLQASIDTNRSIDNLWGEGLAVQLIGRISLQRGDFDEASERYLRALEIHQRLQSRRGEAADISSLGQIALGRGQFSEAAERYTASLAIRRETGDRRGEAVDLTLLGQLNCALRQDEVADYYLTQAITLWRSLKDKRGTGWALFERAQLAIQQQRWTVASHFLEEALPLHHAAEDVPAEARTLLGMSKIAYEQRDYQTAESLLARALKLSQESEDKLTQANVTAQLAALAQRVDDLDRAERLYRQSVGLVETLPAPVEIAQARERLGRFLHDTGRDATDGAQLVAMANQAYVRLGLYSSDAPSM